jgi:hypothetical protein
MIFNDGIRKRLNNYYYYYYYNSVTTSLCIYGLLYHLLYVYLYDRWFPEPRARVKAGYRTCPNNVALPSCPRLASNGIVDKISYNMIFNDGIRKRLNNYLSQMLFPSGDLT